MKLRLKERGLPGKTPGDLYLLLEIALPPADTDAARAAYEQLAKAAPLQPAPPPGSLRHGAVPSSRPPTASRPRNRSPPANWRMPAAPKIDWVVQLVEVGILQSRTPHAPPDALALRQRRPAARAGRAPPGARLRRRPRRRGADPRPAARGAAAQVGAVRARPRPRKLSALVSPTCSQPGLTPASCRRSGASAPRSTGVIDSRLPLRSTSMSASAGVGAHLGQRQQRGSCAAPARRAAASAAPRASSLASK